MYADYDYYQNSYHGTLISESDWTQYAREASAIIDRITYGRLRQGWEVTTDVQNAVCAVADVFQRQDDAESKSSEREGVKSFTNDGYSESYNSITTIRRSYDKLKADALNLWLPRSDPLRYAGV